MIHKEGFRLIALTAAALFALHLILGIAIRYTTPTAFHFSLFTFHFSLELVAFLLVVQFFRNPNRSIPAFDIGTIYAPADGKVVVIEEVEEGEYFHDRRLQVSIFMSPLNVHVNRNPIGGRVLYSRYHAGKYLVASLPKASTENERTTVVIGSDEPATRRVVLMRQVAGFVARRIVCYVSEGDEVTQGADMGFIKFGSRVDLYLPLDAEVRVRIGDVVKGNLSVIAQFK